MYGAKEQSNGQKLMFLAVRVRFLDVDDHQSSEMEQ